MSYDENNLHMKVLLGWVFGLFKKLKNRFAQMPQEPKIEVNKLSWNYVTIKIWQCSKQVKFVG